MNFIKLIMILVMILGINLILLPVYTHEKSLSITFSVIAFGVLTIAISISGLIIEWGFDEHKPNYVNSKGLRT